MEENPYRYQKNMDLHESEWRHDKKKEPILGSGAYWFFNVTLPLIAIGIATAYGVSWFLAEVVGMPTGR